MTHNSNETKAIRQRMEEVRCDLDNDVQGVVECARHMRDWRSYVRTYPWVCVGAVLSVGYWIVPRRHVAMQPNAETIAEFVEQSRLTDAQEQIGTQIRSDVPRPQTPSQRDPRVMAGTYR